MGRKSRRRRRPAVLEGRDSLGKGWSAESEPQIDGDEEEVVEWGGQLIWAAGFTSGGAPYGITLEELRESTTADAEVRRADWARAKRLLRDLLVRRVGNKAEIDIGWVKYLGEGLCRKAFITEVGLHPDPLGLSGDYVVLLPRPDAEPSFDERARFEAGLLTRLAALDMPLRIPRILGLLSDAGRPALIETAVHGIPLDLRAGRQASIRPWDVVAHVAATVHTLDTGALSLAETSDWKLPGYETRREHALEQLSILEGRTEPLLRDVHAWTLENLPPSEPSALIHGDLLGQNIMLAPGEPPGLLDWEQARLGDPAYDLAIVTRGVRRPFQIAGGLDRLLEAYSGYASEIDKEHVRLYELCLMARWYLESLQESFRTHPPQVCLNTLQSAFRRVTGRA